MEIVARSQRSTRKPRTARTFLDGRCSCGLPHCTCSPASSPLPSHEYWSHFTDGETKAQRGEETLAKEVMRLGMEPRSRPKVLTLHVVSASQEALLGEGSLSLGDSPPRCQPPARDSGPDEHGLTPHTCKGSRPGGPHKMK